MDDELDQLLRSLKLPRIRAILDERLAAAATEGPSYAEFLRRLLREEHPAHRTSQGWGPSPQRRTKGTTSGEQKRTTSGERWSSTTQ